MTPASAALRPSHGFGLCDQTTFRVIPPSRGSGVGDTTRLRPRQDSDDRGERREPRCRVPGCHSPGTWLGQLASALTLELGMTSWAAPPLASLQTWPIAGPLSGPLAGQFAGPLAGPLPLGASTRWKRRQSHRVGSPRPGRPWRWALLRTREPGSVLSGWPGRRHDGSTGRLGAQPPCRPLPLDAPGGGQLMKTFVHDCQGMGGGWAARAGKGWRQG